MDIVLLFMEPEPKVPWNLNINAKVKEEMDVYCIRIGRSVSDVTEELYIDFLKRAGVCVEQAQKKRKHKGYYHYGRASLLAAVVAISGQG